MADSSFLLDIPSNYVETNAAPAMDAFGLPQTPADGLSTPAGLPDSSAVLQAPPAIGTVQSIWGSIKQDSQSALSWTEGEISGAYNTTKGAVSTVVGDVTAPVAGALKSVYWYAIIAVIVVAAGLYFVGKGGAVKVNAIV